MAKEMNIVNVKVLLNRDDVKKYLGRQNNENSNIKLTGKVYKK